MTVREGDFAVEAVALRATDKALLVLTDDGEYWVPYSQIRTYSDCYYEGDEDTLVVTEWWARKVRWK